MKKGGNIAPSMKRPVRAMLVHILHFVGISIPKRGGYGIAVFSGKEKLRAWASVSVLAL